MLQRLARTAALENVRVAVGYGDRTLTCRRIRSTLVLMVDVYHEFSQPEPMLKAIRKSLKPTGRIALRRIPCPRDPESADQAGAQNEQAADTQRVSRQWPETHGTVRRAPLATPDVLQPAATISLIHRRLPNWNILLQAVDELAHCGERIPGDAGRRLGAGKEHSAPPEQILAYAPRNRPTRPYWRSNSSPMVMSISRAIGS